MFDTNMIHKYNKGELIGKSYYQGATKKSLVHLWQKLIGMENCALVKLFILMRQKCLGLLMGKKSS